MIVSEELKPLSRAIRSAGDFIQRTGGRGALIGGVALCLVARARNTLDVDLMVLADPADSPSLLETAALSGLVPRIEDAAGFARLSRVLLLKHQPTDVPVDVSLGGLLFEEETVSRAGPCRVGKFSVKVSTPEDLIIMKAIADRPQDNVDIGTIAEVHSGKLDIDRIRHWLREFSELLDRPDRWPEISRIISSVRS